ncbi:MAG: hypothetical protein DRP45_11585 [Candidatus Zixiibacteriota bacterium]|nr:MAG: hypothetical protein DRP45_11585 [candidate division Zixibacteria bacterium]
MTIQAETTVDTTGVIVGGAGLMNDDETLLQDAARVAALAPYTVLAKQQSSGKLVPLTELAPTLTSAGLECGANGGNLAAWQAVGDGAFQIDVDGSTLDITGLVFTAVAALTDIVGIINVALAARAICVYDEVGDVFSFFSLKSGLPASTIGYLVAGSAGTDISGAGFLNGLTGTGTITAATGEASESVPSGIYWGDEVTAADLVAGDVTNRKVLAGGDPIILDEDKIVLEGSLTLASVVVATGKTIEQHLRDIGIFARETYVNGQIAPV